MLVTLVATATPATATAFPAASFVFIVVAVVGLVVVVAIVLDVVIVLVVDNRFELRRFGRLGTGRADAHLGAFVLTLGLHFHGDAVTLFDLGQIGALRVEQIDCSLGGSVQGNYRALALGGFILDQAQRG